MGEYFNDKRAIANGIAFSGSGLGGVIFPVLVRYLLDEYGLNGKVYIHLYLLIIKYFALYY